MNDNINTTFICKDCRKEEISLLNYGNRCYDCADDTYGRGSVKAIIVIILFVASLISIFASVLIAEWVFNAVTV